MIKFSQVAICVPHIANHIDLMKNLNDCLGFDMYSDSLRMKGDINGMVADVDLLLSFNHDLFDNTELEYITSANMTHWHHDLARNNGYKPFLSHFGAYLDEEEFDSVVADLVERGYKMIQNTESYNHSNKRAGDEDESSRHYNDVIFDTRLIMGFNIKLTKRVEK